MKAFSNEDLSDQKPSQLLRRLLQQLVGDRATTIDSTFLLDIFLQRIPNNVRMVLASTLDTVSLAKLAELADKIVEVAAPTVATVQNTELSAEVPI